MFIVGFGLIKRMENSWIGTVNDFEKQKYNQRELCVVGVCKEECLRLS